MSVAVTSPPESSKTLSPTETQSNTNTNVTIKINSIMVTQKTNHVSNVLLYGIPIVSLHIEGQERLCLAQISNTLLKAYSYNEIHNRRVALGITCVQCTPVQLEILRRAGAMPVSSRRCGMITRREAERLCKSFLGDNSPPRLPEDFAFSVQHKCAWGCRGAFLPTRYNSSRAKCIKCTFCGMFFSPNKFIFHSHRLSASDKYVQPDAANFNSWRRHMFLNGQPPEEIVHAWEDVKAMFNGGTRKRLVHTAHNSTNLVSERPIRQSDQQTTIESDDLSAAKRVRRSSSCGGNGTEEEYSVKSSSLSSVERANETADSSHLAILVPPRLQQFQSEQNVLGITSLPHITGFSSQFMVDYMFQAQHQNQNVKNGNSSTCPTFPFSGCTSLPPWLKSTPCPPFKCISVNDIRGNNNSVSSSFSTPHYHTPNLLTTSAFKPVLQQHLQPQKPTINTVAAAAAAASFASSSMYTCNTALPPNSVSVTPLNSSAASMNLTTFVPSLRHFAGQHATKDCTLSPLDIKDPPFSDDDENDEQRSLRRLENNDNEDEDEIEVDIETTEDETPTTTINKLESKLSPQDDAQYIRTDDKIDIDRRHQKRISNSFYADLLSNRLSGSVNSEALADQPRAIIAQRRRQYSCSSSNDSLYMSAQTKSERESSSRATSTTSIEILNEESSNTKTIQPNSPNNALWKEFPVNCEIPSTSPCEESFTKTKRPILCNNMVTSAPKIIASCEMNLQKSKSEYSGQSHHDIPSILSVPITDSENTSLSTTAKVSHSPSCLFDALSVNSNNHFLTSIKNQNKNLNNYSNELWQVASLCLHRPQMSNEIGSTAYHNNRMCLATPQHLNAAAQQQRD